jgi:hypothetical protein
MTAVARVGPASRAKVVGQWAGGRSRTKAVTFLAWALKGTITNYQPPGKKAPRSSFEVSLAAGFGIEVEVRVWSLAIRMSLSQETKVKVTRGRFLFFIHILTDIFIRIHHRPITPLVPPKPKK